MQIYVYALLNFQVFPKVGGGLGTYANQKNEYCEATDDGRAAGPGVQIHANYLSKKNWKILIYS